MRNYPITSWSLATLLLFSSSLSEALLPPLYQSIDEYKALLKNQKLIDKLDSGDAIVDIKRDPQGFTVTTLKKIIQLELIFDPVAHPGPAKFHIEIRSIQNIEP
jgi:hypothetical protein